MTRKNVSNNKKVLHRRLLTILYEMVTMKSTISPGELGPGLGRDQVSVTDRESNPVTRGREGGYNDNDNNDDDNNNDDI